MSEHPLNSSENGTSLFTPPPFLEGGVRGEHVNTQPRIKAHPTVYGAICFRSRLEATWAAFFDLCGWSWAYEPIDLEGWVPDFVLFLARPVYVEVKPAPLAPLWDGGPAGLCDDGNGFYKAKRHWRSVDVLLLGVRPNDRADHFGIGTQMDPPSTGDGGWDWGGWGLLNKDLCVADAKTKWGAALAATQWARA